MLAVFDRSFYLECAGGRLVCFGPDSLGLGPLNAASALPENVDLAAAGVRPGALVSFGADRIGISGGPSFSLAGAIEWYPPPAHVAWRPAGLRWGLRMLTEVARQRAPEQGLGTLIPALAAGESLRVSSTGPACLLLPTAIRGVGALAQWLTLWARRLDDAIPPPPSEVEALIGLGPGLTPSGDDVLAGAMIALRAFSQAALADRLAAWALPRAETATGRISYAHLSAAATGEGAGALHDLLVAITAPDAASLASALDRLARIGHCSGWDALAGSAAALRALCRRAN